MRLALILLLSALPTPAQNPKSDIPVEDVKVYTDHPRIFLKERHLRLLKRERERQSMRWVQFEALVKGGAQMPEPGFSLSLFYMVSGDAAAGKRAVEWALSPNADTRQTAIVYDWCQPLLTPAQSKALTAKLVAAARLSGSTDIRALRTRAFAAVAVADELGDHAEAALHDIVYNSWAKQIAPGLLQGRDIAPGDDMLALVELLHVIRDNTNIDLRESAGEYFKQLARFYIASHYPAPYAATENEYRVPVYKGADPNLDTAAISRAAGLALVAFDTNALDNQFLQGWLTQDRFLMRGVLGCPYEFLWANPYQPGLSYAHLPLDFHDPRSGDLFLRSDWEEDAVWFGLYQGEAQVFRDGHITVLRQQGAATAPKIAAGAGSTVVLGRPGVRFSTDGGHVFVIGLQPHHNFDVEVDDEEMTELETDTGGSLEISVPKDRESAVAINGRRKP